MNQERKRGVEIVQGRLLQTSTPRIQVDCTREDSHNLVWARVDTGVRPLNEYV